MFGDGQVNFQAFYELWFKNRCEFTNREEFDKLLLSLEKA